MLVGQSQQGRRTSLMRDGRIVIHSSKNPLHGMTLEALLNTLVARYGWVEMARQINISCFKNDPNTKSSPRPLRWMSWAYKEVETIYLASLDNNAPAKKADPWAN